MNLPTYTRRPAAAGLLVLILVLLGAVRAPGASAHANLVQSDPPAQSSVSRAPGQIQLLYSEAVEPRSIEVSVLDRDRKQVDQGDARLLPGTNDTVVASLGDLGPGVYTISWAVTSAVDGHTTRGLVPFSVGDAGAVPDPLSAGDIGAATTSTSELQSGPAGITARWLMLLATLALGGVLAAGPMLIWPARQQLRAMSEGRDDTRVAEDVPRHVIGAVQRRVLRICWIALAVFAAGSLLLLAVDAAAFADTSLWGAIGGPIGDILQTRRGILWLIRAGLALVLAGGLYVALRPRILEDRMPERELWWVLASLAAGMLLMTSLGSHSASIRSGAALSTAVDWVHLCAVAVWVGGLVFLGLAFLPSLGPLAGPARTRLLANLVPRFSTMALASVGVILATGLFQTWKLLDGFSALKDLEWGRALVVKLLLFGVLLLLGAFNFLVVKPSLTRYARQMDRTARERAAAVRLNFRRAVLVEVAVGVLVVLVVGVLTGVSPSEARLDSPEGPFRPFVLDAAAEGVNGRLVLSPGRIGNNRFDLTVSGANGQAIAADTSVVLRITTLDQDTGTAEAAMQALGAGRFTASGAYLSTVGLWEIAAVVRQPASDEVTLPFRLSLTEATGRPQVEESRPAAPLARGREIFQQSCAQCHGNGGRGDGPLAGGLRPPPVDLTQHVPLHGDQELNGWITNGIPRTAMPAFGNQFSPEEIQAVINYLRELAKQTGQDR